jgi:hypothetical protein
LRVIADKTSSMAAIKMAFQSLAGTTEVPKYWTRIANSDAFSKGHRRLAVFALFRRHVQPGMSLADVARILDGGTWLKDARIALAVQVSGPVPKLGRSSDTDKAAITVLPGSTASREAWIRDWSVCLRYSSDPDREQSGAASVRRALMGIMPESGRSSPRLVGFSLYSGVTIETFLSDEVTWQKLDVVPRDPSRRRRAPNPPAARGEAPASEHVFGGWRPEGVPADADTTPDAVTHALSLPCSFGFVETPLDDAIAHLEILTGVRFDRSRIAPALLMRRVSFRATDVPAAVAVGRLLLAFGLEFDVSRGVCVLRARMSTSSCREAPAR